MPKSLPTVVQGITQRTRLTKLQTESWRRGTRTVTRPSRSDKQGCLRVPSSEVDFDAMRHFRHLNCVRLSWPLLEQIPGLHVQPVEILAAVLRCEGSSCVFPFGCGCSGPGAVVAFGQ